ncbi:hypothetical protein AVEN_22284-1 [Araneus ventricosus]|uniref:Uncharacterized protein n=1 Tax=Araneus ventricosus TaxID=182803 RepID=A0A4Y2WGF0_ARAVE|nr:hypothetical protein AVEN_22284-1 [Araneus ventricosus]
MKHSLSVAKIKEGVFVGPQIKQLFRDPKFEKLLRSKEKQVWDAFYQVSTNFLGIDKVENCKDMVEDMLALFQLEYVVKDPLSGLPFEFLY